MAPAHGSGPARRDVLRLGLGAGLGLVGAGLAACGAGDGTTTSPSTTTSDPAAAPGPDRTPTPDSPVERVVALSSADLDVLVALGRDPVAAWATEGTGPRPWRPRPAPSSPDWGGPGLPSLSSVLPFGADAFALAAADPAEGQLRDYEQLATVIAGPDGRPGWRDHLGMVARAVDADPSGPEGVAQVALEAWLRGQRELGARALVVVVGTGTRPDTPVATLAADAPLCREVADLGLEVVAEPEPVAYRELRRPGVQLVRVDPHDDDVVTAVRQPSVRSLPWVLERLVEGRRPA